MRPSAKAARRGLTQPALVRLSCHGALSLTAFLLVVFVQFGFGLYF